MWTSPWCRSPVMPSRVPGSATSDPWLERTAGHAHDDRLGAGDRGVAGPQGLDPSSRGAERLVGDATKTARRLLGPAAQVLVRMDSAFYGRGAVHAALAGRRRCR
jgi:hypothetical protein